MAASTYFDQVQQLYIAYFGRPADTVGQAYWADRIDAANGSIASVIAGFSASTESIALFGSATSTQKVTAIYQNAFGRAPEAAGLAYWVAQLDSGAVSQAQASWTIQQAAGPGDAGAVNNKLIAAKAFTAQIDTTAEVAGYNGTSAASLARAYLSKVDSTYASIANVATDAVAAVATATGTAVVTPVTPVTPVIPASPFSVTENAITHVLEFSGSATGAVTLTMADATHAAFSRGGNTTDSVSLASVKGINVPSDAITITAAQAANLATANTTQKIVFDAGDAVTIVGILSANETAALTSFTQTNVGGSSVTLNAADGTWSVSGSSLTTALAANEKLAGALTVTAIASANETAALTDFTATKTGATSVLLTAADSTWSVAASSLTTALAANTKLAGTVTVTGIASADEATALTNFTATNVGANAVVLDATDNTWALSATTLAAATTAGITLATADVVTISNTLAQGLKVIGGGNFQSGNDVLQFTSADLLAAPGGFVTAGAGSINVGGSKANLVVGAGATAGAAEATFLFDTTTNKLSFDADGVGGSAAIDLLTLTGVSSLTAADFQVV